MICNKTKCKNKAIDLFCKKHTPKSFILKKEKKKDNVHYRAKATLGVSVKLRNDYADYDYLKSLNEYNLNWLKGFHREFVNADFQHKYKKLHRKKKHIKSIYDSNNRINRDLYGITKTCNKLFINNKICEFKNKFSVDYEDFLITLIDLKNKV